MTSPRRTRSGRILPNLAADRIRGDLAVQQEETDNGTKVSTSHEIQFSQSFSPVLGNDLLDRLEQYTPLTGEEFGHGLDRTSSPEHSASTQHDLNKTVIKPLVSSRNTGRITSDVNAWRSNRSSKKRMAIESNPDLGSDEDNAHAEAFTYLMNWANKVMHNREFTIPNKKTIK